MRRLLAGLSLLLIATVPAQADTGWTLVNSYPHDRAAFTEGLLIHDGLLYESTGLVGRSEIRIQRLDDGRVLKRVTVSPPYFGEGITIWKDRLISLTWRHGKGFIWSAATLKKTGEFRYTGEGWALTHDARHLIMSDGTAELRFLDPDTLQETGRIKVHTADGQPVPMLNELEYVNGEVLANIWMTNRIARINPASGLVIDWIDLSPLVEKVRAEGSGGMDDVLNGIAWDAKAKRLYVTGKNWPKLFEISLQK
ncbi:MAG TPA: glutaminyl-peptide cyclotransferase [Sphingobium sp.]|uniref:glutaminyl-peptide cyclotransferase n=1 Tax=Sphingobium sp. TaxID=1912891 RepID=UPI002ED230E8